MLGDLLARLDRDIARQAQIQDEADEALAQTAHNLVSQISALNGFLARYRLAESRAPQLAEINDELASFYDHVCQSLRRIKDRVGSVRLKPQTCDLAKVIEQALTHILHEGAAWRWRKESFVGLPGMWDRTHWENVFILKKASLGSVDA